MDHCTWVDCNELASHEQKRNDGTSWAKLCEKHHTMVEDALMSMDAKRLLSFWVKASGGAKKMAESM